MNKKEVFWCIYMLVCLSLPVSLLVSEGIKESNAFKVWVLPALIILLTLVANFNFIRHLYLKHQIKKWNDLKATGVIDFLNAVTMMEDAVKIMEANEGKEQEEILLKVRQALAKEFQNKIVRGVVCGEEITAYREHNQVVVYVNEPETEKVFKKVPKHWRSFVKVVRG